MGMSTSIILLAAGAILAFAVDVTVSGVDLVAVGWILMVIGALGLVLSMIFWSSWGGFRSRTTRVDPMSGRSTVIDERVSWTRLAVGRRSGPDGGGGDLERWSVPALELG